MRYLLLTALLALLAAFSTGEDGAAVRLSVIKLAQEVL
jgi:hypothetical protein